MPINRLSFYQFFFSAVIVFAVVAGLTRVSFAQTETDETIKKTSEPVFRVSKLVTVDNNDTKSNPGALTEEEDKPKSDAAELLAYSGELPGGTVAAPAVRAPHPLDRALTDAQQSLVRMRSDIKDYSALMAKKERVNGVVGNTTFMSLKIRCPRTDANGNNIPFSIYMRFLKPKDVMGREVIWVDGQNDGQMFAHEGRGIAALRTFKLDPDGMLAKRGQRYPIYSVGIENLIVKLIDKAQRDKTAGPCLATYDTIKKINRRECSVIEVTHDKRQVPFEFYKAKVFIDKELGLPVRYAAYDWPRTPGGEPELIEEYTYFNIKTNVGLDNSDFDPSNRAYKFPGY